MAYLQSNEPYQRIRSDTPLNGLAIGAALGASAAGAQHLNLHVRTKRQMNRAQQEMASAGIPIGQDDSYAQSRQRIKESYMDHPSFHRRSRYFGSGVRKALTYGTAAAVGGVIGTLADAVIDS